MLKMNISRSPCPGFLGHMAPDFWLQSWQPVIAEAGTAWDHVTSPFWRTSNTASSTAGRVNFWFRSPWNIQAVSCRINTCYLKAWQVQTTLAWARRTHRWGKELPLQLLDSTHSTHSTIVDIVNIGKSAESFDFLFSHSHNSEIILILSHFSHFSHFSLARSCHTSLAWARRSKQVTSWRRRDSTPAIGA